MRKIITKSLVIYMVVALVVAVVCIFGLQTAVCNRSNEDSSIDKLAAVVEKLESNEEEIAKLTNSLGENNLAKSRAFADILAANPSILNQEGALFDICNRLMVNELHVIDGNGIITHSTVDAYIGFDMNSGEQSAAFMVIVADPSIEIVQEPQQNAAEGIVIQYVGVARKDAPGFVQVGIQPEILAETLAGTEINVVLKDFDFGKKGYVFAIDKETGEFLAHPDENLVGTVAADAGLKISEKSVKGKAKVAGVSGYYYTTEYNDMILGTFLPASEYYSVRTNQTIAVSVSMLVIFALLLTMINRMISAKIITGLNKIGNALHQITEGNFDIIIDERSNPEFSSLSNNINTMVESILSGIKENKMLMEKQETDMENNLVLFENVRTACADLGGVSERTLSNADDIYNGAEMQKQAVQELSAVIDNLVSELNRSADTSTVVTESTAEATQQILHISEQIKELNSSMESISYMSAQIETIIDEINSISSQTNLLALNASIEAARAGDAGRGFAVVATEVGQLAERSSQAAKETTQLITNSIAAIDEGKKITENTVQNYGQLVAIIKKADSDVEMVSSMIRGNVGVVNDAANAINKIEEVVNDNVAISQNSKQISEEMATITNKIVSLVEV